jgi:hypothetical protein
VAGPLTFGIYPGSAIGDDTGGIVTGPPDLPDAINDALDELQGPASRPFLVRAYHPFTGSGSPARSRAPVGAERYLRHGRRLDLVAQYQPAEAGIDGYRAFIEELIDVYGDRIATLQVGEEPNVTTNPSLDGWYPRVSDAIIGGVAAAKAKARRDGLTGLRVGCNSTPLIGPAAGFLAGLTAAGGDRFIADLDYIGLDFFPDVFRPIPADRIGAVVAALLTEHRHERLTPAGLGHLPLVITEHGWPTGPGRPPRRQADVLRTVVETTARLAGDLTIAGYTHFSLRDARSADPDLFAQFGLMTDDYAPKPAFHTYRDLIADGIPAQ